MSSHVTLTLHLPEETVTYDIASILVPYPSGSRTNPISDYFTTSESLVRKIVDTKYADDAEVLGLLVLGVVSSAEFYFRSILAEIPRLCPVCEQITESVNLPAGASAFYSTSGMSHYLGAFEHESFADAKRVITEIKRFAGFQCVDGSSLKKALEAFDVLCELRHCFVHVRGFAGLKAIRTLNGERTLQKVLVRQAQALELIKLSHNAVRATNRFLADEVVNRWIDRDVLSGEWPADKALFGRFLNLFGKSGEDAYSGSARKAYKPVQAIVLKRKQGIAAQVAAAAAV